MRAGRPWETRLRPRSRVDTHLCISLSVAAFIAASAAHAGLGAAIDTSEVTRHDVEVQLGVTGDLAGGEVLQRFWHGLTNSPEPRGWDRRAERYVWDFDFGVTARFRNCNITYAVVRRSEEFVRTVGTDSGINTFTSLSLTVGLR